MRRALGVVVLGVALAACHDDSADPDRRPDDDGGGSTADAGPDASPSDGMPDETAPETVITSMPTSPTGSREASFEFTADEPDCSFRCAVDGAALASCTSPHTISVDDGEHTFQVVAVDAAGN